MDNRNAFERQLADEIGYEVGPPLNVDALAITRQAKTTSPLWRFFPMSTTVKFTAAAAGLAIAGTAILLLATGGLTPDDGALAPGAESPTVAQEAPTAADMPNGSNFFTGTYTPVGPAAVMGSETTGPEGLPHVVGEVHTGETIETSDPRVSGSLSRVVNWAERVPGLYEEAIAWRLENEGGSWTGHGTSLVQGGPDLINFKTMVLFGNGDYEGLTAVVFIDGLQNPYAVEGAVIAGEPLPVPEPLAE